MDPGVGPTSDSTPLAATASNDHAWQSTANRDAAEAVRPKDDSLWPDGQSNTDGFRVLHEWRGVRANQPMSLATPDDEIQEGQSDEAVEVRHAIFSQHPGEDGIELSGDGPSRLTDALAMVGHDQIQPFRSGTDHALESMTVPSPPPLDVNSGIRVFPKPTTQTEESSSVWPWLAVLAFTAGMALFTYRRRNSSLDS